MILTVMSRMDITELFGKVKAALDTEFEVKTIQDDQSSKGLKVRINKSEFTIKVSQDPDSSKSGT